MANDLTKFPADTFNIGIDTFSPDFSPQFALDIASKNISTGINSGPGPRYGMSPIPGQQDTERNGATDPVGLRQQEAIGNAYSISGRGRAYGVIPLNIAYAFPDLVPTIPANYFFWLVSTGSNIEFCVTSTQFNTTFTYPQPDIASGLNYCPTDNDGVNHPHIQEEILYSNFKGADSAGPNIALRELLNNYSKFYLSFSQLVVSGADIDMNWCAYEKNVDGDGVKTATGNFNGKTTVAPRYIPYGMPSSINYRKFDKTARTLKFYNNYTDATYGLAMAYSYIYSNQLLTNNLTTSTSSSYVPALDLNLTSNTVNTATISTLTPAINRYDGIAPAFSTTTYCLLYDPLLKTNTGYTAIFIAGKRPLAVLAQGWTRNKFGYPFQVVDPCNQRLKPGIISTDNSNAAGFYTENLVAKATCWKSWPSFTEGTPAVTHSASPRTSTTKSAANSCVALGDEDSGILRADTIYEFAYSIYNKMTDTESNVGEPAKLQTGTDDFVRVSLFRDIFAGGFYRQTIPYGSSQQAFQISDEIGANTYQYPLNYLTYRVYFREFGSYEWLPALDIDAAQYEYYPDFKELWMCEAPVASLPGGQPGAFIDYSELPQDEYICTLTFQNRTFWLSRSNLIFSLRNNGFAYPLRNSAPAPNGQYRGAIVHTYRGQSDQESRLVIFGQNETYIGKFTGIFQQMPIVISPDVTANYDVDGSDFTIETWTSITAFSNRAAVVADGDLYWWGPQGVYMDNGVGNPVKISGEIEPDVFDLYYQADIDVIHCCYTHKSREIAWYYTPKSNTAVTHALIYNTQTRKFFIDQYESRIDWSQNLDTYNGLSPAVATSVGLTPQNTNSLRTVVGIRRTSATSGADSIQRAYFHDLVNRSGDLKPKTEFMIKQIANGSTSSEKVITLATGFDATNYATIIATDRIAIQQFKDYSLQTTGDDMICQVVSTNGTNTITVQVPAGAVLPNVVLSSKTFAPIWQATKTGAGLNGISWELRSKYWMPAGVNFHAKFLFMYMFYKYTSWFKIKPNTFNLAYRTPSGADFLSDTLTLVDNSDANSQIFHALRVGGENNQGQAIKLKFSGFHIGDEWVLQYLEAHTTEELGNILKRYQG